MVAPKGGGVDEEEGECSSGKQRPSEAAKVMLP